MFKKILDWLGPNLDVYKVENANDVGAGLVRHKWQGEQTATQIGTTLTSDILNNFQKGLIPFVETSRTAGTNKDIYSITVIGLKEFGIFEGLKILIQIDNQNQYDDVVVKTDNTEYPLYIIKNGVGISPKKGYLRNKNFYFITFKGNAFYLSTGNTFGTEEDTFLEGKRLSEIIGLEFGGNIQDTGMKSVGKFYFDTVNKYYYECIVNNNLTYNDVTKFRAISNKPLSDRLENLHRNGNNYVELPSGLIFQWGSVRENVNATGEIIFPKSFKNSCFGVFFNDDAEGFTDGILKGIPRGKTKFSWYCNRTTNITATSPGLFTWFAIGV